MNEKKNKGKNEEMFKEGESKTFSNSNSLSLNEKFSPEIKPLKKTPGISKLHQNSNEKNSRHEKGLF